MSLVHKISDVSILNNFVVNSNFVILHSSKLLPVLADYVYIKRHRFKSASIHLHLSVLFCLICLIIVFFGSKGHVALDRNPGPRYNTLLLRLIPGDLLIASQRASDVGTTLKCS